MFIGEVPGADENLSGKPFVGKAGKLLRSLFKEVGFNNFYLTNVVKCRPPNNRNSKREEFLACADFLRDQIKNVKPKLIVLVGAVALKFILKNYDSMYKLR